MFTRTAPRPTLARGKSSAATKLPDGRDGQFEKIARMEAKESGWEFDKLDGDMTLMQKLVDGPWDNEEFLTVEPGHRVATSFDDLIIKAEAVDADG